MMREARPPKTIIWLGDEEDRLFDQTDIARLKKVSDVQLVRVDSRLDLTGPEVIEITAGAELVISTWDTPLYTAEVLAGCPSMRFYGRVGGSVRGIIDPTAWDHGVRVVSAADAQGLLLADLTVTLMLAGLHRIPFYVRQQWAGVPLERVIDHELVPQRTMVGKRVGLIGFGSIARHVARLLRPFTGQIASYDPYVADDVFAAHGVARVNAVDDVCAGADVVSIHAAFNGTNHHLLGAEQIARLKHGALVVNTSYGELIDMAALSRRLAERSLFACLDMVTGGMPGPFDSLRYQPTCQITPTVSHYSDGVPQLMGRQVVDEAIRHIMGEPLQFEVPKTDLAHRA